MTKDKLEKQITAADHLSEVMVKRNGSPDGKSRLTLLSKYKNYRKVELEMKSDLLKTRKSEPA